jgi:hypothetical protein
MSNVSQSITSKKEVIDKAQDKISNKAKYMLYDGGRSKGLITCSNVSHLSRVSPKNSSLRKIPHSQRRRNCQDSHRGNLKEVHSAWLMCRLSLNEEQTKRHCNECVSMKNTEHFHYSTNERQTQDHSKITVPYETGEITFLVFLQISSP